MKSQFYIISSKKTNFKISSEHFKLGKRNANHKIWEGPLVLASPTVGPRNNLYVYFEQGKDCMK